MNLLVMNVAWSAASFSFYMVNYYLKYLPGDMFSNVIIAGVSEAIINIISGFSA
jgi:hypothetical protein